jgi:hypothetical protein
MVVVALGLTVLGCHGLLQSLDRFVQLLLPGLRLFLVLHGLHSLGFVDALELTVLSRDLALHVLERLDLLLLFMRTLLELGLFLQRFVEAGIEHIHLLLALGSLGLCLL